MKIRVTKLEAAVRQLNSAISLWFADGDPVSVHTLASASHQIIHDIVRAKGGPELLFDSLVFKAEYRSKANGVLRAPQNFFKHAVADPDGALEFSTEMPELFMLMSLAGLEFLEVADDEVRSCFAHWFALNHTEFLTEKGKRQYVDEMPREAASELISLPKLQFFETYRVAYSIRAGVPARHSRSA